MASEVHGKYLIVSRPDYNPEEEVWLPQSFVMWGDENGFHSHHLNNPNTTFEMEKEAVLFSLTAARAWIAEQL